MISLRKYLDAAARKRAESGEAEPPNSLQRFSSALLDSIHQEVLAGDGGDSCRTQLLELRDAIRADWQPAEEAAAETAARRILCDYRASVHSICVPKPASCWAW